jgi:preprotein translocase subunit YajC
MALRLIFYTPVFFLLLGFTQKLRAQEFENRRQKPPSFISMPIQAENKTGLGEKNENIDALTLQQMQEYQNMPEAQLDSAMIMVQFEQMAETMKQIHPGIFYSKQYDTACFKAMLIEIDTSQFQAEAEVFRRKLCEQASRTILIAAAILLLLGAFYLIVNAQEKKIAEAKNKVAAVMPGKKIRVIMLGELDENLNKEYIQIAMPANMVEMLSDYFRTGEFNKEEVAKKIQSRNQSFVKE